jgi:hypothetical protein
MILEFLDQVGLAAFKNLLANLFATKQEVTAFKETTDSYVIDIDYIEDGLSFDVTQDYKEILVEEDV